MNKCDFEENIIGLYPPRDQKKIVQEKRGKALIISCYKNENIFDSSRNSEENDCEKLGAALVSLNFDVQRLTNSTKHEIIDEIERGKLKDLIDFH